MMENLFSKAEDLAGNIRDYVNTRIDSLKLNAAEKSSKIIGNGAAAMVVVVFVLFSLGLGSIALSWIIGIWMGKIWAGFLVVAGFYLLLALITWLARGKLIRLPVMNAMIHQMFKEDEEDNKHGTTAG
jgi:hypothetical protein